MRNRRILTGAAAVFAFALALRLGPLVWSPLPFNPDGFSHASVAEDVLAFGAFPFEGIATDQVGYASLLSMLSALTGEAPLAAGQPTSAVVGAASVLVGVLLADRLATSAGWSRGRARAAGLLAGLFLAVEGVYLYRSMATDEQTAAFLLVAVAVLAADRWVLTGGRHWAVVAAVVFAPLAPLHNLSGLIGAATVSVAAALAVYRRAETAVGVRAVVAAVLGWTYVVGYHVALARYTGAEIVQAERLVAVPGLFVAWIALAVLGAAWFVTTSSRIRRGSVVAVVLGGFGLLAVNAVRPIYPGTTETPAVLLYGLLPLVVPGVLAGLAAHRLADRGGAGSATVALVAGPLAFVGTGLTAGLTFEYLSMVYRSQLFVHVPLLVLAGIGTVAVASRFDRGSFRATAIVLVIACVVASAPIAYAELDARSFKGVTTEADFAAADHVADSYDGVATDDHLARIVGYHGGSGDQRAIFRWLREGGVPPDCPTLARESWTGVGAQIHPQRPASIDETAFEEWQLRNDVPYTVFADDTLTVVRPPDGSPEC